MVLLRGYGQRRPGWMARYTISGPKLSSWPLLSGLCLLVPEGKPPEGRVPAGEVHAHERGGRSGDAVAPEDRDHDHVGDHDVVHLDEQRRPLDRVDLAVGRLVGAVVLLAAEAGDVPPL